MEEELRGLRVPHEGRVDHVLGRGGVDDAFRFAEACFKWLRCRSLEVDYGVALAGRILMSLLGASSAGRSHCV